MGKKIVKPIAATAKAAKALALARPIDALFSKTRQRVLTVLFGNPQRSFYANEIITLAAAGTGSTQRELASLTDAGLIVTSKLGNQKHFQANPEAPLAAEIYALVRKTMTLAGVLGAALAPSAGDIELALVHGTPEQLRDTASDEVALLLVSNQLGDDNLTPLLAAAATTLSRRLAVTLCTPTELADTLAQEAGYLSGLQSKSKLWLIGTHAQIAVVEGAGSQL
jgi:hypothetical protein